MQKKKKKEKKILQKRPTFSQNFTIYFITYNCTIESLKVIICYTVIWVDVYPIYPYVTQYMTN